MLETTHHWLPIILAVYLPVSFIITYSIAVGKNHIEPLFPYISDTGIDPPERCVFSQLLNIGAAIAGVIIYTRYRLGLYHFGSERCLLYLNSAAFIAGIFTTVGVSVTGNFQKSTVTAVHYIGAFLAFGGGLVYMILQTIISYKSASLEIDGNSSTIRGVRVALCVADAILLVMCGTGLLVSQLKGPGFARYFPHWSSDKPGYAEHLLAAISQWLVAFVTVIYFATFFMEFKHFTMKPPEVEYKENGKQHSCCPAFCSNKVHPKESSSNVGTEQARLSSPNPITEQQHQNQCDSSG